MDVDSLATAERAAIAEEVASVLRHDLRNKLAVVRNAASFIRRRLSKSPDWQSEPKLEEFARIIETEIAGANEMLGDRMGLQRLFARHVAVVDAARCAGAAVAAARVAHRGRFALQTEPAEVELDATELTLAVRCLVENAAEATGGDGSEVHVGVARAGARVNVEVRDAGPGIAPDGLAEALRPFATTKEGHAGLGLNIAQRIAHRYRGSLELAAVPGGGMRALLSLPAALAAAPTAHAGG